VLIKRAIVCMVSARANCSKAIVAEAPEAQNGGNAVVAWWFSPNQGVPWTHMRPVRPTTTTAAESFARGAGLAQVPRDAEPTLGLKDLGVALEFCQEAADLRENCVELGCREPAGVGVPRTRVVCGE
jgi:hypothetical protein